MNSGARNINGRPIGVGNLQSDTTANEKVYGKKNKLVAMMELKSFVLLYTDGTGLQQKPHVVHELAGKFYSAPDAITWGASLRELEPWLQELAAKHQAKQVEASLTEDSVNVVAEGDV